MTKYKLIKFLEPFTDNIDIEVVILYNNRQAKQVRINGPEYQFNSDNVGRVILIVNE